YISQIESFRLFYFNKKYFFWSVTLFLVLVCIALFVNDKFVRPFLGDVIVVGWLYLSLKSFITINRYKLAHFVLVFSYVVEVAQYLNLVSILGLQHIDAVRIIFGATFDWLDLLAYTIGWGCILLIESRITQVASREASTKCT
ncbi:TPA: DUF2809 domain-containing protein, partial [Vibrio parahaemolyticus]